MPTDPDKKRRRIIVGGSLTLAGLFGWHWYRRNSAISPAGTLGQPALPNDPFVPKRFAANELLEVVDASQQFTINARRLDHALSAEHRASMLLYDVEQAGRNFLNPILEIRRGQVLQARFWNQLDETSIVHWHGLKVDANNDGNPYYAVRGGEIYPYRIPIQNRAATCWYHPHPHGAAAGQIYQGLASFLIVRDEDDDRLCKALDLKLGVTDMPLLIQDRRIDHRGQFVRVANGTDQFLGYLGAEIMVNYQRKPMLDVTPRVYRLRLLNGSSARIFRLAFMQGERPMAFQVIGTDNGLLERPLAAKEAFLAPGERLDILLDLRELAAGTSLTLRSLAFDAMREPLAELCRTNPPTANMTHGQMNSTLDPNTSVPSKPIPDGTAMDLLAIRVLDGPRISAGIPTRLSSPPTIDYRRAAIRTFDLDHHDMQWRINGVRFDMVKTQVNAALGSTEVWEFRNPPLGMPHPMHLHGFAFKPIERVDSPAEVKRLEVDKSGLAAAETGFKDTILVWPGERVRVAVKFDHDFPGEQVYMLHCHNLEHEDQGMMLNVRIVREFANRT